MLVQGNPVDVIRFKPYLCHYRLSRTLHMLQIPDIGHGHG